MSITLCTRDKSSLSNLSRAYALHALPFPCVPASGGDASITLTPWLSFVLCCVARQRARQRSAAVSLRQQQLEQEASDVAQRKAARAAADAAAAAAAAAAVAIVQVSAAALEVEVALRTRAAQAAIAAHAHVQGRAPTGQSGAAQAKARADAAAAAAAAYGDPRARPLPSWTERTHDEHALVVQCAARRNIAVRVAQQERARLAEALRKEVMLELKEERERSAIRLQAAVRGRFARAEQERRRAAESGLVLRRGA